MKFCLRVCIQALLWNIYVASSITSRSEDDVRMLDLITRFFNWRIQESPEYGLKLGISGEADRLEEFTEAAFERQIKKANSFLKEVDGINTDKLSTQNEINFQVLKYNLQTFIDGYQYRRYGMYNLVTPMERPIEEWFRIVDKMRFKTEDDYRRYLRLLQKLPQQITQQIALMRLAIANNITVHNVSLTGALASIDRHVNVTNVTASDSFKPLARIPSTIPLNVSNELQREGERIIRENVIPSWTSLRDFIANEYSQATRSNVSVSSLPGGLHFYKVCLKWHTSVDWSPEDIHRKGLQEVARIERLMDKIKAERGFNGTLREFIIFLNQQRENFYNTSDAMLDGYRAIIAQVHNKLPQVLLHQPRGSVVVTKATNPQTADRYSNPPLDNSRPGTFIANVFSPETQPKYNMPALTLHEAEPGHHIQAVYVLSMNIPNFRRFIEFRKYNAGPFNWPFHTAYVEGWGLYAEALGEEMNVYKDSLSLFGRYASELFRACRLVVDTGIHAFGWSKERAVEYLTLHTTKSATSIDNEVNRYISWPGQACAYKIGELKIWELRRRSEMALGSKFDKRQFHHEILKLGPVPLSLLEKTIDNWISASVSRASSFVQYSSRSIKVIVFSVISLSYILLIQY